MQRDSRRWQRWRRARLLKKRRLMNVRQDQNRLLMEMKICGQGCFARQKTGKEYTRPRVEWYKPGGFLRRAFAIGEDPFCMTCFVLHMQKCG